MVPFRNIRNARSSNLFSYYTWRMGHIGALCATRMCQFSERRLGEMLSTEFQAMMLFVKSKVGETQWALLKRNGFCVRRATERPGHSSARTRFYRTFRFSVRNVKGVFWFHYGNVKLNMKSSQTPRRRAESDEKPDSLCVVLFQRIEGEHKQWKERWRII